MNADSTFIIGATHAVCQDYAVARDAYAIVSDGCSASPDTDIGARLLVKAAEQLLHTNHDRSALHEAAARLALEWAKPINLPPESLDATLLTAFISDDELLVTCSGDGVIVAERNDGGLDVHVISFPSGYPFYPAYWHQPDRLDAFLSTSGPIEQTRHFRFKTSEYKYVALVSDGIHSFLNTSQTITSPVSMAEVLGELVSFKSLHGAFVARRVKRFIKDCRARGWQHSDDLSIAAIHPGGATCSPNISFQV
jgi:serine/threonine protein phosphatase PrpC